LQRTQEKSESSSKGGNLKRLGTKGSLLPFKKNKNSFRRSIMTKESSTVKNVGFKEVIVAA
jgi:hypothetical protein